MNGTPSYVSERIDRIITDKKVIIGNIVLPSDIDRDEYVAFSLKTKTVCVRARGAFFRNCPIATMFYGQDDIIASAFSYPENTVDLGTQVICITPDNSSLPIVIGVLPFTQSMTSRLDEEGQFKVERNTSDGSYVVDCRREGVINIVSRNINGEGAEINISCTNADSNAGQTEVDGELVKIYPAQITLTSDNLIYEADDYLLTFQNSMAWVCENDNIDELATKCFYRKGQGFAYLDEFGNYARWGKDVAGQNQELEIDCRGLTWIKADTQMVINAPEIYLGDKEDTNVQFEPMVLGDQLVDVLSSLCDAINQITVPTAMGTSGVPLNVASFTQIKNQLNDILSQKSKLE